MASYDPETSHKAGKRPVVFTCDVDVCIFENFQIDQAFERKNEGTPWVHWPL